MTATFAARGIALAAARGVCRFECWQQVPWEKIERMIVEAIRLAGGILKAGGDLLGCLTASLHRGATREAAASSEEHRDNAECPELVRHTPPAAASWNEEFAGL